MLGSHFLNRQTPIYIGVLLLAGVSVYYPAFFLDFQTRWDDQWVVMNAYTEYGLTRENLWSIITEFYHGQYAPMNQLYYTLLYSVFGYDPVVFHGGGVLLHLLNSFLVFRFIGLLQRLMPSNAQAYHQLVAFLTALLFMVHPVLVESVAWISASKVLIYSLFFLLSLNSYITYLVSRKSAYLWLSGLFFILSFGGKEQAVVLPLCLLLLDWVQGRHLSSRQVWLEKVPFLLLALLFGYITMLSQAATGSGVLSAKEQYPLYQRAVFASYAFTEYLTKCVLPIRLSYIYPFPVQIGEVLPIRFWIYPLAVVGGLLACWKYWSNKWILFSLLFFLINIAVTLHIIPISRFTITADRYVYISTIAIAFILNKLLIDYLEKPERFRGAVAVLGITYLFCLAGYTAYRIPVWQDSDTLKEEIKTIIEGREDYDELLENQKN